MADESISFALDLEGNAAAFAAEAGGSLDSLQESIQGDIAALRSMQQAMRALQGASVVNVATVKQLRDQITSQKAKVAAAQQAYIHLGGTFKNTKRPTQEAKDSLKSLADATRAMPGPLSQLSGKLSALRSAMAGAAAGPLLIAAALTVLAAAAVGAATALVAYGIKQADARRSELLHLEALTKLRYGMFSFYTGTTRAAMSATQLQSNIDDVAASVPLARSEVAKWEEQLYKMGLRGANLRSALEGATMTASAQGDAQAQAFANWAAGANLTGQSVKRLSEDVKSRLGGIVEKQMLSLDVLSLKLHENLDALFRDVKIDGFLKAIKSVTDLFSQNKASGRALKHILDTLFSGVNSEIGPVALIAKRFFQGLIIGALLAEKGFLKLRKGWIAVFGDKSALANVNTATAAVYIGVGAVFALTAALGVAAVGAAILLSPLIAIGWALLKIVEYVPEVIDAFEKGDWVGAGAMISSGIVKGILAGLGPIGQAALMAADAAEAGFKAGAQIHSPSRVMMKAGGHVSEGVAIGMRAHTPAIRQQARRMAQAPAIEMRQQAKVSSLMPLLEARSAAAAPSPIAAPPTTPEPKAAPRAASGTGTTVHIDRLIVQMAKGQDAPNDIAQQVKEALERELRGYAVAVGAKGATG